ncbi:Benzoate transport protein [Leifsonia rubra CMS 76R]|nr:Benzoate transport protein [Leifsonia rubra CMS 76R]
MLAGILLPMVVVWLLLLRVAPRWAVPGALLAAVAAIAVTSGGIVVAESTVVPQLSAVAPVFDPLLIVGLGIPLFIVTMAGQNVPGFTVMRTYGYVVPPVSAGVTYVVIGLGAGFATALVTVAPPIVVVAIAGLAVMGAPIASIRLALEAPEHRIAAIATFLVASSGITVVGIGSAFWALVVGAVVMVWLGWRPPIGRSRKHVEPLAERSEK